MLLDFAAKAASLKRIARKGWIDKMSIESPESVADHSFCMAVIAMAVSDLRGLDTQRILKMALLHDLAESETGDLIPEEIDRGSKARLETDAFERITEPLPASLRDEYRGIWREYMEAATPESRLAHQLDKLEMALQAGIYREQDPERDPGPFYSDAKAAITDKHLKEMLDQITSCRTRTS